MSFAHAFKASRVEGWQAQYCDYDTLVRLVERCRKGGRSTSFAADEQSFVVQCEIEYRKVEGFLVQQIEELRTRLSVLSQQCERLPRRSGSTDSSLHDPSAGSGQSFANGGADAIGTAPLLAAAECDATQTAAATAGSSSSAATVSTNHSGSSSGRSGSDAAGQLLPAAFPSKAARASVRSAFVLLYREARHLESYALLNAAAFAKAAHKFRKARAGVVPLVTCGVGVADTRSLAGVGCSINRADPPRSPSPLSGTDERLDVIERGAACGFGDELASRVGCLQEQIEAAFRMAFFGVHAPPAEARTHLLLRLPAESPAGGGAVPRRGFLLGWRVGGATLLLVWLGWDLLIDERLRPDTYCQRKVPGYSLWQDPAIHVYHFAAALLLLEWCWCGMLIVWRRSRINFPFLLELPQTGRTAADNLASAAIHSMLFALNMLLFFKVHHHDVFQSESLHRANRALPLLLCIGVFASLIFPWRERKQIWILFGDVLLGFFRPVRFVHVFFADWLTSVVKVWVTMAYATCFYTTGEGFNECPQPSNIQQCEQNPVFVNLVLPVLSTLPYVIRLLQCLRMYLDTRKRFPHLANAWKYCFALLIIVIGSTHQSWKHLPVTGTSIITNLWIATYAISTLYTYSWDVFMDWGLSFKDGRPYVFACAPLRRDRRMIHPTSWMPYYLAVGADVFLRFLWTLTLAPSHLPFGDFVNYKVKPLLSFAEILRRAMWSLFRVENEHLNSTLAYKSVPIVPLHLDERAAPPTPADNLTEGPSYVAVGLEVTAFIVAVLTCYILSYATHS